MKPLLRASIALSPGPFAARRLAAHHFSTLNLLFAHLAGLIAARGPHVADLTSACDSRDEVS